MEYPLPEEIMRHTRSNPQPTGDGGDRDARAPAEAERDLQVSNSSTIL